ncbi:hypothetical protein AK830_g659 [Neonectria ditissima]|uniref:IQ domain-containing protein IQM6 n=1 Tax=Neonectria ditissima TaxID=78410 RepID=A0A0P7BY01_9HYPO|nr:hypothetical protein AK830_g659 [Neonectria ditissima]
MTQLELLEPSSLPVLAQAGATPPSRHPPGRADSQHLSGTPSSSSFNIQPKTKEYMDSLVPPTPDGFERIASVQQQREDEQREKARERKRQSLKAQAAHQQHGRRIASSPGDSGDERERAEAAELIQKTFRGYRARREMQGFSLDAGTRWITAMREAQFRNTVRPRARSTVGGGDVPYGLGTNPVERQRRLVARGHWKKATVAARRANQEDLSSDSSSSSSSSDEHASPESRTAARLRRDKANAVRRSEAQVMGLQYFLEMVDLKHRYGSNLRMYHEEWKRSDTNENYFYWLDYGEGRNIELDACPRDRLEREQVRYLSREERQHYLVDVDAEGRLCWAKNGKRIDTTEDYKDSIHGVVPSDDPTPVFNPAAPPAERESIDSSSSDSATESRREADRAAKYATPEFDNSGSFKKVTHISASTVFNKLLRKSVKKNTWIFVADTSFRLYVGIKNSGAFQHSSFLQGGRISAAGLIKIKNGRLRSLSPLSGHYRPPVANFRAFVRSLRAEGVDTSHVAISKSYAVLVGLEAYLRTRRKGKEALGKLVHGRDKILAPDEVARREEEARDKSKSAEKERRVLEREEAARDAGGTRMRMMQKLSIGSSKEVKEPAG